MEMPKKTHVGFVEEMAAVAQIVKELQTEAQLKTNAASVEEMGLLALVIPMEEISRVVEGVSIVYNANQVHSAVLLRKSASM